MNITRWRSERRKEEVKSSNNNSNDDEVSAKDQRRMFAARIEREGKNVVQESPKMVRTEAESNALSE